jgi:hypothetical protein
VTIEKLLTKYPKKRLPLPNEYKLIYEQHYKDNREGNTPASSISSKLEKWMHKKVSSATSLNNAEKILEIGAGTLNHLQYEKHYIQYDIVEPFKQLYASSAKKCEINNQFNDIKEINSKNKYDKIMSIAVLEHVLNLPELISRSATLLVPKGKFLFGIPSQGTFGWKLGYTLSTGINFRLKYGLDYATLMNYEHVNTAKEIETLARYFFKKVDKKIFGFSNQLSFYQYFCCSEPDIFRCQQYLKIAI